MISRRAFAYTMALMSGAFVKGTAALAVPDSLPRQRDNCSFLMEARKELWERVGRGEISLAAEREVYCPLCRETIAISAQQYKDDSILSI